ncbi:hypothetical protein Pint_25622 [Pistacia integerrima]|uniref:Uncharacterized protein n=1 Tax=Pistacia integerrima TaxID=434235 RepID=A0ACC0YD05_9ROSI|nr:hypothetical protein Pint_25622 [Pistacia integerrima]
MDGKKYFYLSDAMSLLNIIVDPSMLGVELLKIAEMGLTTTKLLNAEKFPVLLPNSTFSSQLIVNKSCAQWRAVAIKIPLHIDDLDKIPQISNDIKSMLRSNTKVFLGREAPYCFLSQIESSFTELTLGCILKTMSKDELYTTEQDIRL